MHPCTLQSCYLHPAPPWPLHTLRHPTCLQFPAVAASRSRAALDQDPTPSHSSPIPPAPACSSPATAPSGSRVARLTSARPRSRRSRSVGSRQAQLHEADWHCQLATAAVWRTVPYSAWRPVCPLPFLRKSARHPPSTRRLPQVDAIWQGNAKLEAGCDQQQQLWARRPEQNLAFSLFFH